MSVIDFSVATKPKNEFVPAKNQLDVEAARKRFSEYEEKIRELKATAEHHAVTDDNSMAAAVEIASRAKRGTKAIEDLRKSIVAEPNNFVKSVNSFSKIYTSQLSEIESNLKSKISRYQIEQERKRREQERKAKEEAAKLQAKLDAEAKEHNETPIVVPEPVVPDTPKVTRTESGSASFRKDWTWREVDFSKVPDEYKTLDAKKINQAVKSGMRNIPGLEIYEETKTILRT